MLKIMKMILMMTHLYLQKQKEYPVTPEEARVVEDGVEANIGDEDYELQGDANQEEDACHHY